MAAVVNGNRGLPVHLERELIVEIAVPLLRIYVSVKTNKSRKSCILLLEKELSYPKHIISDLMVLSATVSTAVMLTRFS
jgi:hypothetical protein